MEEGEIDLAELELEYFICYRYIVQYAAECGGVIVSTDNFRDLLHENPAWRETIEKRWGKLEYNTCVTLDFLY
jgi:hypothetical protein